MKTAASHKVLLITNTVIVTGAPTYMHVAMLLVVSWGGGGGYLGANMKV